MVAMVAFVFLKIFFFVDINKPTEEAHDIIFKRTTSEKKHGKYSQTSSGVMKSSEWQCENIYNIFINYLHKTRTNNEQY